VIAWNGGREALRAVHGLWCTDTLKPSREAIV